VRRFEPLAIADLHPPAATRPRLRQVQVEGTTAPTTLLLHLHPIPICPIYSEMSI
jgi:hypothetical protein